jgi:hydroxymethylpyrimidine/phosphomethylpyrimidine kinase
MTAITAITAQNTQGVYGVQEITPALVAGQIEAVYADIRVDAVKIGMVSSAEIAQVIQDALRRFHAEHVVLDPVMVSKSGCRLLRPGAEDAVRGLAAIAGVVTPNIPEAELLCGFPIKNEGDMQKAAEKLCDLGAKSALIKGGHWPGTVAADLLFTGGRFERFETRRIDTKHTHGTGCTLSSAIACRLALGDSVADAVRSAKDYLTQAIMDAYPVGGGAGPVGHLNALYRKAGMEE